MKSLPISADIGNCKIEIDPVLKSILSTGFDISYKDSVISCDNDFYFVKDGGSLIYGTTFVSFYNLIYQKTHTLFKRFKVVETSKYDSGEYVRNISLKPIH